MEYVIGVDIGGTCTDCVILDELGAVAVGKAFSTPSDFSQGVLDAVKVTADGLGLELASLFEQTNFFLHATTIAENAIVAGDLAKSGILVTKGFEDTLSMMRGGYAEWSGRSEEEIKNIVYASKPPPLIPVAMIRGIKERVDSAGEVLLEATENEVVSAVQSLVEDGAEAVGIAFLWSFMNPQNEVVARETIKRLHPALFCTTSHEIAPILGEFERTQTVALNIRLGPAVSSYLDNLQQRLEKKTYTGPVLIMQAYGGLLNTNEASSRPVGMIESGPVSGLVGCNALGKILGFKDIIGADMGGTTFKAGVIGDGRIDFAREPMVNQYHYASPKMNMESIGLAGGSIISIDPLSKTPRIGPKSAGSDPGPVCYNKGGQEPTISDVDLLLGYLNERFFLDGRAGLDRDKALAVFKSHIADPLGMDVMDAAGEVYRLANNMIYDMLHKLTVENGVDPRPYVLFSYGGTLGMHVTSFAPELGVRAIIVPYSASVLGAAGLLTSDITYDEQISRPLRVPVEVDMINEIFAELTAKVMDKLRADGFEEAKISNSRAIDLRYRRQVHVVMTPVEIEGAFTESNVETLIDSFHKLYEQRFGEGSGYSQAGVEMVNFRLRGVGHLNKPVIKGEELGGADPQSAYLEDRQAYFGNAHELRDARCYDFVKLLPGNEIEGPAIIWTPITTIVVNPGQKAVCDAYRNLHITW